MLDVRVLIVGEDEISREGLRRILSEPPFHVENTFALSHHVIEWAIDETDPPLIIVDERTDQEALETTRILRSKFPAARCVIIAHDYHRDTVMRAFELGVDGYLTRMMPCASFIEALKLVSLGEKVVPSQVVALLSGLNHSTRFPARQLHSSKVDLSEREIDILRGLVRGEANKVIARHFEITEATVKVHVKAILRKLGVANRTQAAIWAISQGLCADTAAPPAISAIDARGRYPDSAAA
jgi:two-component system, NarL family, nitrate/nitrite response regulator NarL